MFYIKNANAFGYVAKDSEKYPAVEDRGKNMILRFATTEKDSRTDKKIYSNWRALVCGEAYSALKGVQPGEKIVISEFKISNPYVAGSDGKKHDQFSMIVMKAARGEGTGNNASAKKSPTKSNSYAAMNGDDGELPF